MKSQQTRNRVVIMRSPLASNAPAITSERLNSLASGEISGFFKRLDNALYCNPAALMQSSQSMHWLRAAVKNCFLGQTLTPKTWKQEAKKHTNVDTGWPPHMQCPNKCELVFINPHQSKTLIQMPWLKVVSNVWAFGWQKIVGNIVMLYDDVINPKAHNPLLQLPLL